MIQGRALALPAELEQHAKNLATISETAGKQAAEDLMADPVQRISSYFAGFAQRLYLEGFFRALAYYRTHRKEGRLKRLRTLWESLGRLHTASWPIAVYDEFDRLLTMGDPGESDAESSAHEDPPVPEGDAHVPR